MLEIHFPDLELWDETNQRFIIQKVGTFKFEHSLLSIAKWETIHKKPFLVDVDKTPEELLDYFKCMCTDNSFDKNFVDNEAVNKLATYINESQTATTISNRGSKPNHTILTSEVLYASMAMNSVPFSADKWPLSRLMAVLGVIADAQTDPKDKRMSKSEIAEQNREINAQRRKEFNTEG